MGVALAAKTAVGIEVAAIVGVLVGCWLSVAVERAGSGEHPAINMLSAIIKANLK